MMHNAHHVADHALTIRMATTLHELLEVHGKGIQLERGRVEGMLRDRFPRAKREVHALSMVLRCGHAMNFLSPSSSFHPALEVQRIAHQLNDDFGIEMQLAQWAVETWAIASRVLSAESAGQTFACPACNLSGYADTRWRNRQVVCPGCSSILSFSSVLEDKPKVVSPSSESRPTSASNWLIIEEPDRGVCLYEHVNLKRLVERLLSDAAMSPIEKARALPLHQMCIELGDLITNDLQDSGFETKGMARVRRALIVSVLESQGVAAQSSEYADRHPSVRRKYSVLEQEAILGMIDLASFDLQPQLMLFTDVAVYLPVKDPTGGEHAVRIDYETTRTTQFRACGRFEIDVSPPDCTLDTSRCSMRRDRILTILNQVRSFEENLQSR